MTTSTTNAMVNPIEAVVQGFRKYASFGGRATRAEFWWWALFIVLVSIVLSVIESLIVWAIVWLARQGGSGENRFGPDPRV